MPISAVIICKNEELNIERCLKSLSWVDEIVVYDSGSTDRTLDIAQKLGAKIYQGAWFGFGATKFEAAKRATCDWILSIDSDEEVPKLLQAEIKNKIANLDVNTVYKIPRLSFYLGRWIKHGGWYPDFQIRLFNRSTHQWNQAEIHESIVPTNGMQTKVESLNNHLNHFVFKNIEHQVQTNNRYSTLQAKAMYKSGKKFSYVRLLIKPYVKFIECYIFKLGFLDGWAGYVIARNAAYSMFLKWLKLKELYDENK